MEPPWGNGQGSLGSSFLESTHPSPPLLWVSLESLQPPITVEEGVTHSHLRDQMGSEKTTGGFHRLCLCAHMRGWCVRLYQWGRLAPWVLGC